MKADNTVRDRQNGKVFLILFLGMIFGFGPFLTDMYLPAFPQLQSDFQTDASTIQLSLSACMLGLALGQAVWGPMSDKYGRRPITVLSLTLFSLSCVGCMLSPNVQCLIFMRLLQGMGGSGGLVLSRSIASDLYTGQELAKIMAIIGAVNGIAPVTAPVIGGLMTDYAGWRGIFAVLLLIGLALTLCSLHFRESLQKERRTKEGLRTSWKAYKGLIRNKPYVWCILQYGCLHGIFFSYLSSSPFIVQDHYGFTATEYSIFFAVNAATVGLASALSMKFSTPVMCTRTASYILLIITAIVTVCLITDGPLWLYESCTLTQVFCCGLCFASTPAITMDIGRRNAGAAAALLGICTYVFGCIVTPLVGLGQTMTSTAVIYIVSALATALCASKVRRA